MVESRSVSMMAFRHGFLVSVLCLIFLLNIHFTALKFVPVFYKSMHLPKVQFSWHGLDSSGYTKEEVSQLELGYSNVGLSTFVYG